MSFEYFCNAVVVDTCLIEGISLFFYDTERLMLEFVYFALIYTLLA